MRMIGGDAIKQECIAMIDVTLEETMSLSDAAKLPILPKRRGGKPVQYTTLLRWASSGVRGVKLETVRWGDTLCTSREALLRFAERLSEPLATNTTTTASGHRRSMEQAAQVLAAAGI
jgi:hypothetical protein